MTQRERPPGLERRIPPDGSDPPWDESEPGPTPPWRPAAEPRARSMAWQRDPVVADRVQCASGLQDERPIVTAATPHLFPARR